MKYRAGLLFVLMLASSPAAVAALPESAGAAVVASAPAPAPAAPLEPLAIAQRYDLPWQLRSVATGSDVRVDGATAVFNDPKGNLDVAATTVLSTRYQLTARWAPMLRLGFVGNDAPGAALDGSSVANPLVGARYAQQMGGYTVAFFGATTLPIGTGGGSRPRGAAANTNAASMTARPGDQAMYAVNYLTATVGADCAYLGHGFTAQGEVTLQQSLRVRGAGSAAATDSLRTNSSVGLHLGYFIGSHFSLGADLLYQRWLSHPTALNPTAGTPVPLSGAKMDTLIVAAGPRLHFRVGRQGGIHPGLAFSRGFDGRGFDAPLLTAQPTAVQLDIPVTF